MISVKNYQAPPIDMGEILRYMGCKDGDDTIEKLIDDCLREAEKHLVYKVCYKAFNISPNCDTSTEPLENTVLSPNCDIMDLGFVKSNSKALIKNLDGCSKLIVFAATIGLGLDRLISKYSRLSPARALCFQAIGAERIEGLCNLFNKDVACELALQGLFDRPRFSPGYGDLPLDVQRDIFKVLDCYRKIGLSLNESLLMSPSKSLTAIIGFSKFPRGCKENNSKNSCKECNKQDCNFRRD